MQCQGGLNAPTEELLLHHNPPLLLDMVDVHNYILKHTEDHLLFVFVPIWTSSSMRFFYGQKF